MMQAEIEMYPFDTAPQGGEPFLAFDNHGECTIAHFADGYFYDAEGLHMFRDDNWCYWAPIPKRAT